MDPPKGRLPRWARLIPDYLKPLGYRCYHAGKWHVHGAPKAVADGHFDRSYKLDDQDRFFSPRTHFEDDRKLPPVEPDSGYYATVAIADQAIRFLNAHADTSSDEPFFLYLAFTSPHFPLQAREEDIARYRDTYTVGWDVIRQRRYDRLRKMGIIDCALTPLDPAVKPRWNLPEAELQARIGAGEVGQAVPWASLSAEQQAFQSSKMAIHAAMIDRMDREIGRVLDELRAMEALDDTLILFASDNGASAEQIIRGDGHDPAAAPGSATSYLGLGPGWSTAANTPFRMHKSWVHEGGIATPLIVSWPEGIASRGELRTAPGHVIDIVPTLLDVTDATPSPTWNGANPPPLPGRSLVPAFQKNGTIDRDFLFWNHDGHHALRIGDWKLVTMAETDHALELYNLDADRCEMVNLATRYPDRAQAMAARWQASKRSSASRRGRPTRPSVDVLPSCCQAQRTEPMIALVMAACLSAGSIVADEGTAGDVGLFDRENLVAWCIVPFDDRQRSPEARAEMLERLGIHRFAYDWRSEHLPQFEEELDALDRHGIELTALWFPTTLDDTARYFLDVLKTRGIKTQLWVMGGGAPTETPQEQATRVQQETARIRPIAEAANEIGCSVGLYNHGGWFGEPENQLAIINALEQQGIKNVGIVYNLHHGHEHLDRFPELLERMKPHLMALNLNGMNRGGDDDGEKILVIGQGEEDRKLLQIILDSGWQGHVGILNHTSEDAEARLAANQRGLQELIEQLNSSQDVP